MPEIGAIGQVSIEALRTTGQALPGEIIEWPTRSPQEQIQQVQDRLAEFRSCVPLFFIRLQISDAVGLTSMPFRESDGFADLSAMLWCPGLPAVGVTRCDNLWTVGLVRIA